jgi:hypothetical protein
VLSQIFFQQRVTDLALLGSLRDELEHCQRLNLAMQRFLRAWSGVSQRRNRAVMHDQAALPWFAELNRGLNHTLDDAAFKARIRESAALLQRLAAEIVARARHEHPGLDGSELTTLLAATPAAARATAPVPGPEGDRPAAMLAAVA